MKYSRLEKEFYDTFEIPLNDIEGFKLYPVIGLSQILKIVAILSDLLYNISNKREVSEEKLELIHRYLTGFSIDIKKS